MLNIKFLCILQAYLKTNDIAFSVNSDTTVINISFVMCAFLAWWQNTVMDVTFRIMNVTVCKKDKEISDVKM